MRGIFAIAAIAVLTAGTPAAAEKPLSDADQIAKILNDGCKAAVAKDADGMMAPFKKSDTLVMFDFGTPRSRNYAGLHAADEAFAREASEGTYCNYLEIHPVILSPNAAYSWSIMEAGGTGKGGTKLGFTIRSTDIWQKIDGSWKIIHEHNSFPVDMKTGIADMQSKP